MVEMTEISDTMPPRLRPRLKRRAVRKDSEAPAITRPHQGQLRLQVSVGHFQLAAQALGQLQIVRHHQKSGALTHVQLAQQIEDAVRGAFVGLPVGSSASTSAGLLTSARAIATR